MADLSQTLIYLIKVDKTVDEVPGLNPTREHIHAIIRSIFDSFNNFHKNCGIYHEKNEDEEECSARRNQPRMPSYEPGQICKNLTMT